MTEEEYIKQDENTMFFPEFEVGSLWRTGRLLFADDLSDPDTGMYTNKFILKEGEIILIVKRTLGLFYCEVLYGETILGINTVTLAGDKAERIL